MPERERWLPAFSLSDHSRNIKIFAKYCLSKKSWPILYRNLLCTITINNGPTLLGHTAYRFNFALVKSWLSPSVLFKPQVYFHKTCNFLLSIGESVWWLLDLFLAGSQHQFISSRSVKFHFYSRCANWIKYTHSF